MKGVDDLIKEHPFMQGFDENSIQILTRCAQNIVFDSNSYIFKEGGNADYFYLIRHGKAALELHSPGKDPVIFQTLESGDILGSAWIVPPYHWTYDARAIELVRAIAFDAKCLRQKCETDKALGYELMKRFMTPLVQRLQAARLQSANIYHASDHRT